MGRKIYIFVLLILLQGFFIEFSYAAISKIPNIMSAPVVLYDEANNVLEDGDYDLTIVVKDSLDSIQYTEEQIVTIRNGVANITVGEGYAVGSGYSSPAGGLSFDVFNVDGEYSVEVSIDGQSSSQEITTLGSQPYSFISQYAVQVADDSVTSNKIKDGTIKEGDLNPEFLEKILNASSIVVKDDSGNTTETIDLNAKNIIISSDIDLNNAGGSTVHSALQGLDNAIDSIRGINIDQSIGNLSTDLSTHATTSTLVHGVSGKVVGTTDTQTLTKKTIEEVVLTKDVTVSNGNIILDADKTVDGVDLSELSTSVSNNSIEINSNITDITEIEDRVTNIENKNSFSDYGYTLVKSGSVNMCDDPNSQLTGINVTKVIPIESTTQTFSPGINHLNASVNAAYVTKFKVRETFGPQETTTVFDFSHRYGFQYDFNSNNPSTGIPQPMESTLIMDINYVGVGACTQIFIDYEIYKLAIN